MVEILTSVKRVSDIIGEISAASTEQSQGIGSVNVSVTQLDQMTQQNAALVEESAAAAESLKEQATRLASAVSAFKLGTQKVHAEPVMHVSHAAPSSHATHAVHEAKHEAKHVIAKAQAQASTSHAPTVTEVKPLDKPASAAASRPRLPTPIAAAAKAAPMKSNASSATAGSAATTVASAASFTPAATAHDDGDWETF